MKVWTTRTQSDTGKTIASRVVIGEKLRLGWYDGFEANWYASWMEHYEVGRTAQEALNKLAESAGLPEMRPPRS